MNETASGGVSRSGRVRKKTAKLMEMEVETQTLLPTPKTATAKTVNQIQAPLSTPKNVSKSVIQDQDIDDDQPPKKKIKIKLSLGPSPSIVPDKIIEESKSEYKSESKPEPKIEDHNVKKGLIPPLKIPKSKIAGALSPQPASSMNITENQVSNLEESHPSSYELKIDTSIKEEESQSEQSLVAPKKIIFNNKPTKIKLNLKSDKSVKTPDSNVKQSNFNGPIPALKSPKLAKPKMKEQETPANKLFKQITSGISSESIKKKSKATPAKTFAMNDYDDDEDIDESPLRAKKKPSKIIAEKKDEKKNKKVENEKPKKKRATVITAYMLWSKENRSKIQQTCPPMDFAGVSRKLGEIWRSLPKNEKTQWKRKAQKLAGKGQSALISTGKPIIKNQNKDISTNENSFSTSFHSNQNDDDDLLSDEPSPIGTTPIDVAAHLRLLGESLNIIGQRLKEHSGQIAVSGSLSVLLDSTLCAIGPLLCLTKLDPNLDGCSSEVHKKTLDNIAYIMPGI